MTNGIMMQYFEYNLDYNDHLYQFLMSQMPHLKEIGITAFWLPPAFKGASGKYDVGYGVYDLYDLGEFYQKGTVSTKYGTKEDYLEVFRYGHELGFQLYCDIVFNHKMGADSVEVCEAVVCKDDNRNEHSVRKRRILAPTSYYFKNRNNLYSSFKWHAEHFNGVDYDLKTHQHRIFQLHGQPWNEYVDHERGNYDYLMGSNINFNNVAVREELKRFGHWYSETVHMDGFRLDALKHIDYTFYNEWLDEMRKEKDFFAVGEYWQGDSHQLVAYLERVNYRMSLFDITLHYHFFDLSRNKEYYDLRNLYKDTLVTMRPQNAVTFVDNHDTQIGQALNSYVVGIVKRFAYACILLRVEGYPCVFYGDYYGLRHHRGNFHDFIDDVCMIRHRFATGEQHDYIEVDYFGFTRSGGVAVLFGLRHSSSVEMYVGKEHAGTRFYDVLHPSKHVTIDENGCATFSVAKNTLAIYIKEL